MRGNNQKHSINLRSAAIASLVGAIAVLSAAVSAKADNEGYPGREFLRGNLEGIEIERIIEDSQDELVELGTNTVAVIELEANITTGYNWQVSSLETEGLRILGKRYINPESKLLGAPGTTLIFAVGEAEGVARLTLDYKRPYMEDCAQRKIFRFRSLGQFEADVEVKPEEVYVPPESMTRGDPESDLPDEFNWCDNDGCTPVKDQGECGSCWAFATMGPFEQLVKIRDAVEEDLSEQYLVSCANDYNGCMGGSIGYNYLIDKSDDGGDAGAPLEETFPYVASNTACNGPYEKAYRGIEWGFAGTSVEEIKQAIYDHGPLYADVCANDAMSDYTEGVFTEGCNMSNHGVVITGWNETEGYWHMRNSWGAFWGDAGYMKIGYGVSQIASIAAWIDYDSRYGYAVDPRISRGFFGLHCGEHTPESIVYTIVNNNAEEALDYQIVTDADWLVATPESGTLAVGESADIALSLTEDVSTFDVGEYHAKVRFENPTNGLGETTRYVSLTIEEAGEMVYSWNFDEDPGWTAEGVWGFGTPTGEGGSTGNTDPTSGYTGDNVYGVNLNGDYSDNMSQQFLTTTAIDCSNLTNTSLRFWRWLGVERAPYDHAYIRVSTDLNSWQNVWQNTDMVSDGDWTHVTYDISPYADGQSTVYIRWILGVTDMGLSMCGWNIDDVEIWEVKDSADCDGEDEIDAGVDTDTDTSTDTDTNTDTATDTGTDTGVPAETDEGGGDGCGCGQAGASSNMAGIIQIIFSVL